MQFTLSKLYEILLILRFIYFTKKKSGLFTYFTFYLFNGKIWIVYVFIYKIVNSWYILGLLFFFNSPNGNKDLKCIIINLGENS